MLVQLVRCISALKHLIASRADFRNEGSSSVALYYLCGLILSSDETLTISSHVTCCTKTTCFLECIIRIAAVPISRIFGRLSTLEKTVRISHRRCRLYNSTICTVNIISQSWLFFKRNVMFSDNYFLRGYYFINFYWLLFNKIEICWKEYISFQYNRFRKQFQFYFNKVLKTYKKL